MNCQLLNSSQWQIYIINSADNMKLLWYGYIKLLLIPLITLGHLLVPLLVTVIVFHNLYVVTVVLLLPFSDFLTLSLIQGLFSWTQVTLYKVGGLGAIFPSNVWTLPSFCQSVLIIHFLGIIVSCFHMSSACSHFTYIHVSIDYFAW